MVYIPFPRTDLDNDSDLTDWRNKNPKNEGDWTALKPFLAKQPRLAENIHPIPKCWYTELPQGDDFATDVEHFRPKNQASPLSNKQLKILKQKTRFDLRQNAVEGAYHWLEFDYRNYRLVTALPNRGGGKHIYFPIAERTTRLVNGQFSWSTNEHPYFLDPTNPDDAALLIVIPNGEITPSSPKMPLNETDFDGLPATWQSDGFKYMRAEATILVYRLNDKIFQAGRREVYAKTNDLLERLRYCLPDDDNRLIHLKDGFIQDLTLMALPSAPFALAARCALMAYLPPNDLPDNIKQKLESIVHQILNRIAQEVNSKTISWENQ